MDIQTLFKKVEESDFTFEFSELIEVFSQPISTEIAEVESLIDLVLDIKYKLITEGDYSKVEAFVKTLETHQPNIINGAGKYFYHDLVEHFCATGDFKKAEDFFEPFIKDPLSDFDFYIMTFKKLLLYQRNTVLLRAIKQNYNAVRDSDRLVNGALRSFNHSLFSISTQEVYEKSDQNFDLDLLQEKLQPYDFDFSEDPIDAYNIGFYGEIPATEDLMIRFNADKDVMLLLLRNIFVKRMLNNGLQFSVSTLLFDLTRNYWDKKSNNKRKGNWKTYFKIKRKSFDDYLDELKGSFLAENYDIMFALTWGVAYVYDFLLEIKIIDSEHYAEFQEGYKQRIAQIMGSSLDGLYNRAYVMQWPKSEAVTQKEWEAQQSIFKKSLACQHDPSQDMIELIVDDIEAFGKYKMDILEAHEESLAFRNELEDMMHSYEDELFDDEIFDEFEDVDEEDYNIFDSDNDDFEDAEIINKNYIPSDTPFHAEAKPGRNEPCPCGSGKKYKKCCGKNG